jgi:hypothetical protein
MSTKEQVANLVQKIEGNFQIDKSGAGKVKEGVDIYASTLPEGVTIETVNQIAEHDQMFVAASTTAFGKAAAQAFQDNKDLTSANIEVSMGAYKSASVGVERSVTYPGMSKADGTKGEPTTKHLVSVVGFNHVESKTGPVGTARRELNKYGAELFGSK